MASKKTATPTATPAATPENGAMEEVGDVGPEILNAVSTMQTRMGQILHEIGRIEVRKTQLVHELNRLETQSQSILKGEADRLGIPEGRPWQLTPDGKALAAPA